MIMFGLSSSTLNRQNYLVYLTGDPFEVSDNLSKTFVKIFIEEK